MSWVDIKIWKGIRDLFSVHILAVGSFCIVLGWI